MPNLAYTVPAFGSDSTILPRVHVYGEACGFSRSRWLWSRERGLWLVWRPNLGKIPESLHIFSPSIRQECTQFTLDNSLFPELVWRVCGTRCMTSKHILGLAVV